MKTIRVTGRGSVTLTPDMFRITIKLEGRCKEYGAALQQSADDTEALRETLRGLGFRSSDLKTTQFDVETAYEWYKRNDKNYKRFVGYDYRHRLKLEFPRESGRLGAVLEALANGPVRTELAIAAFVKDQEAAKNELLALAVADSAAKAAVMARAAGASVGELQSIDYSWGTVEFATECMDLEESGHACKFASQIKDFDVEPDDISSSDTVTVVWELR